MALPANIDHDKLSEAALAILGLTAFGDRGEIRAWKGMEWDLLDELYQRDWIYNPRGKAKSVVFTPAGAELAGEFLKRYFSRRDSAQPDKV